MSAERLPPLADAELTQEQRQAAEAFRAGRGYAVHGPFAVMLRSPEVMLRAKAMGDYLRFRNVL
ncbi:MAG TPA: carboxymuconolactone decarboxylase family protein, partial [Hyphomicrobiaceae bacterium]|nr:carboxymuconolactone decarboxylase family protein [Hyphomicrobiaceae bacterium]